MTLISKMQAVEHDLNHEMILLRRRMLGYTQAHVADSLGVSQGFLSKLEQGLKEIDEPLLDKLCDVLRCRRTFFAHSERIYGVPLSTHPMIRKHASVGQFSSSSNQLEACHEIKISTSSPSTKIDVITNQYYLCICC